MPPLIPKPGVGHSLRVRAVELIRAGRRNEMVCLQGDAIGSVSLAEAASGVRRIDPSCEQVRAAAAVGTSLGSSLEE